MNIDRAMKIDGWMEPWELAWLAQQASQHKRIVEIGCYRGRSLRALADNTPGEVWGVDKWEPGEVYPGHLDGEVAARVCSAEMSDLFNVHLYPISSLDAAKLLGDQTFDMIFIDADHDYEAVKADILTWGKLLADGGLLCGHDYNMREWPGVAQAVDELIPTRKIATGYIWYKP